MNYPMATYRAVSPGKDTICPHCGHEWTRRKGDARQCPKCKRVLPAAGGEPRLGYSFNWTFTFRELRDFVTGGTDAVLDGDQLRALFPRGVGGPIEPPAALMPRPNAPPIGEPAAGSGDEARAVVTEK